MLSIIPELCVALAFTSILFAIHSFTRKTSNRASLKILGVAFAVIATQSAILFIQLDNGSFWPGYVLRPALAMTIGPLLYLYSRSITEPSFQVRTIHLTHAIPALVVIFEFLSENYIINIDVMIITSFAAYALTTGRIAFKIDKSVDFPTKQKSEISVVLKVIASLLAISTFSDLIIYIDIEAGGVLAESETLLAIISIDILTVGAAIILSLRRPSLFNWQYASPGTGDTGFHSLDEQECKKLITAFEQLIHSDNIHQREHASLGEVARQLCVPRRHLSLSINTVYGESYSKRMNRLRVAEAKKLMQENPEKTVTQIMYDAGFRTKSSFNNEFKSFEGQTPSQYKKSLL